MICPNCKKETNPTFDEAVNIVRNDPDHFGMVIWERDDVIGALKNEGIEDPPKELVDEVMDKSYKIADGMMEAGWEYIKVAIENTNTLQYTCKHPNMMTEEDGHQWCDDCGFEEGREQ